MADSDLSTSISALKTKIVNGIPTANVNELVSLARAVKALNLGEDKSLEDAINARANALVGSASADDVARLAGAIKQVLNPASITVTTLSTITGDLIPDQNIVHDLGSSTNRFKDLYLSGNTAVIGDSKISDDGTGIDIRDTSGNPRTIKAKEVTIDDGTGNPIKMKRGAGNTIQFLDSSDNSIETQEQASAPAMSAYNLLSQLPTSGVNTGTQAYVAENNKLYLFNGTGWYNIALISNPITAVTGNAATYELANDGTPLSITLSSSDPDGIPLQWSHQVTSGSLGGTTITNVNNVFTITPSTNNSDAGEFTVSFIATNGENQETSPSSFTLSFSADWSSGSLQHSYSAFGWDATSQGSDIALSEDGNKMIVGNPSTGNNNEGAWSIFTRSGASWGSPTHITYADNYERGRLGTSVAMDANGTRVAISAVYGSTSGDDSNRAGNVIIYTLSGTTATREAVIAAETNYLHALNFPTYGGCISMDKLGERLVVGHAGVTAGNRTNRGQAHIYKRTGTTWAKEITFESDYNYDYQGNGVAISGDGNTVFITRGAGNGNSNERAQSAAPSVKIYTRSGTSWSLQTEIDSPAGIWHSNRFGGLNTGAFGSISCTNDGNILVIGDGGASSNGSSHNMHGKAWVFTRTGTSWDSGVALTPSGSLGTNDGFGTRVTIDDNGTVIVVGKPQAENSQYLEGGGFHVFQKNGSGSFVEVDKISNPDDLSSISDPNGPQHGAKFGQGLCISGDSYTLGVGAPIHFYYANGAPTGWYGDHFGKTYFYTP